MLRLSTKSSLRLPPAMLLSALSWVAAVGSLLAAAQRAYTGTGTTGTAAAAFTSGPPHGLLRSPAPRRVFLASFNLRVFVTRRYSQYRHPPTTFRAQMEQARDGPFDVTDAEVMKCASRETSTSCRRQPNFVVVMQQCPAGQGSSVAGEGASIFPSAAASKATSMSQSVAALASRARTRSRLTNMTTTEGGAHSRDHRSPQRRIPFGGAEQSDNVSSNQPSECGQRQPAGSFFDLDAWRAEVFGAPASSRMQASSPTGAGLARETLKSDKPSAIMADYRAWAARKARSSVQLYSSAGQRAQEPLTRPPDVSTTRIPPAPAHVSAVTADVPVHRTLRWQPHPAVLRAAAAALLTLSNPRDSVVEAGVQTEGAASARAGLARRTGGRQRKHFREQRWKREGYFPCKDAILIDCWDEHGNLVESNVAPRVL